MVDNLKIEDFYEASFYIDDIDAYASRPVMVGQQEVHACH